MKCEGKLIRAWVHNFYTTKRKESIVSHKSLNKLKLMLLSLTLRVGIKRVSHFKILPPPSTISSYSIKAKD